MRTLPISTVKSQLDALVDAVSLKGEQISITQNGSPVAVLIGANQWESLQEQQDSLSDAAQYRAAQAADDGGRVTLSELRSELGIADVAASLQERLGRALLSVITERDTRTVARWVKGEQQPPQASEQRLRDAFEIMELLTTAESGAVGRAWFMGMNPQLNDETPAEVLAEGRAGEVLAAARAFIDAG